MMEIISRQEAYRKKYKQINRYWRDSTSTFLDLIEKELKPDMVVLDFGCGYDSLIKHVKIKDEITLIGIDCDKEALNNNKFVNKKIFQAETSRIDLPNNSMDLIVCSWIFEHIENPQKIFSEFFRILKRGGKVVFLTPNKYNYVVILSRLLPRKIKAVLRRIIENRCERKIYKTYYRLNSEKQIKKYAHNNFDLEIIFNGDPTYIAFNSLGFWVGVLLEKIMNFPSLKRKKVHLIGMLSKI